MANDLNQCNFIGRLGADPEVRYLPDGKAVTSFSIACGESWKDKDGNKKEKTEWVKIVLFGKLAEIAGEYLTKGKLVFISGKLQTRSWEDKDGNKRYTTEVVANTMQMLGGNSGSSSKAEAESAGDDFDQDVPF